MLVDGLDHVVGGELVGPELVVDVEPVDQRDEPPRRLQWHDAVEQLPRFVRGGEDTGDLVVELARAVALQLVQRRLDHRPRQERQQDGGLDAALLVEREHLMRDRPHQFPVPERGVDLLEPRDEPPVRELHREPEQRVLRREVVAQRPARPPGLRGDRADGGVVDPVPLHDAPHRLGQLAAAFLVVDNLGHRLFLAAARKPNDRLAAPLPRVGARRDHVHVPGALHHDEFRLRLDRAESDALLDRHVLVLITMHADHRLADGNQRLAGDASANCSSPHNSNALGVMCRVKSSTAACATAPTTRSLCLAAHTARCPPALCPNVTTGPMSTARSAANTSSPVCGHPPSPPTRRYSMFQTANPSPTSSSASGRPSSSP